MEEDVDDERESAVPEKLVYVQIEKSVDDADAPSNLTFVSTEAEFKPPSNVKTKTGNEKLEKRHDL